MEPRTDKTGRPQPSVVKHLQLQEGIRNPIVQHRLCHIQSVEKPEVYIDLQLRLRYEQVACMERPPYKRR